MDDRVEDRDLSDSTWNSYMRKYQKSYKVLRGEDMIDYIRCKHGKIMPFSIKKGLFLFYGGFHSQRKKNAFLKIIPSFFRVSQNGHDDCVITFPMDKLSEMESTLNIRKRRQLTDQQKDVLRQRLNQSLGRTEQ